MAEISFVKTNAGLVPHTPHDKEIYNKWKLGGIICGEFKQVRNPKFHRKFFALLNLAFDYYEPSSGVLTDDEKRIATKIFTTLDNHSNNNGVILDFGREFLKAESEERRANITNIESAFEPFRRWAIIESGFYDWSPTPSGRVKVARSISFARMDEIQFGMLYKSIFHTLWCFVLSRVFNSEAEAEEAANNLLTYT